MSYINEVMNKIIPDYVFTKIKNSKYWPFFAILVLIIYLLVTQMPTIVQRIISKNDNVKPSYETTIDGNISNIDNSFKDSINDSNNNTIIGDGTVHNNNTINYYYPEPDKLDNSAEENILINKLEDSASKLIEKYYVLAISEKGSDKTDIKFTDSSAYLRSKCKDFGVNKTKTETEYDMGCDIVKHRSEDIIFFENLMSFEIVNISLIEDTDSISKAINNGTDYEYKIQYLANAKILDNGNERTTPVINTATIYNSDKIEKISFDSHTYSCELGDHETSNLHRYNTFGPWLFQKSNFYFDCDFTIENGQKIQPKVVI